MPTPLILPRRRPSYHGSTRGQRGAAGGWESGRTLPTSPDSERDDPTAHYYYYPTTISSQRHAQQQQQQQQQEQQSQAGQQQPQLSSSLSGPNPSSTTPIRSQMNRRHSVSGGSPWTTIPPRHALHMPVMKIDPTIWRSEQHQRDIHRLLHEGRQEEVMKRRGIMNVMDITEEEDEEDENNGNNGMSGVVETIDLGGFKASEEREKELIRQQVRQEWARIVAEQTKEYEQALQQQQALAVAEDARRRNSWPNQIEQQHQQQQQLQQQQLQQQQLRQLQQQQQQQQVLQMQLKLPNQNQTMYPVLQQQRFPEQPPVPGQQLPRLQFGQDLNLMTPAGPLSSPAGSSWPSSPIYPIDTNRPSFMTYRG
ncbi:hypothetical protein BGX26_003815 [Mortierella sp. AD094]|nr:hypothetical protein BGX26_003815 [Mortierella sp. AD094]